MFLLPYLVCEVLRTIVDLIYLIYSFHLLASSSDTRLHNGVAYFVVAVIGLGRLREII